MENGGQCKSNEVVSVKPNNVGCVGRASSYNTSSCNCYQASEVINDMRKQFSRGWGTPWIFDESVPHGFLNLGAYYVLLHSRFSFTSPRMQLCSLGSRGNKTYCFPRDQSLSVLF